MPHQQYVMQPTVSDLPSSVLRHVVLSLSSLLPLQPSPAQAWPDAVAGVVLPYKACCSQVVLPQPDTFAPRTCRRDEMETIEKNVYT